MVRRSQATTLTFAATQHFDDASESWAHWEDGKMNVCDVRLLAKLNLTAI